MAALAGMSAATFARPLDPRAPRPGIPALGLAVWPRR
jgi:hypothetical protein